MFFPALAGGFMSMMGGIFGGNRAIQAANIGAQSDADKLKIGTMRGREQDKGVAAGGIGQRVGQELASDLGMQRERQAFDYMTGLGADKKRGATLQDMRSMLGFRLTPEYGEARRREFARKKDYLRAQAMFSPQAGMFGPINLPRVS